MSDQWQELKETIVELRDSNGTGTQQEVCKFLANYMDILEKQMQEPCEDEYIKVPKKALKYRTAGMVAYNAEWLKNNFDIERAVICGAQEPCKDVPDINDGNIYECSCGYGWDKSKVVRHHFCPNCGKAVEPSYNSIKTELKPCDDAVSRQAVLDIVDSYSESQSNVEDVTQDIISDIVALPPVTPQPKSEDIAKAFQMGLAIGFGERYDELDKVINEIKKVITPKTGHWKHNKCDCKNVMKKEICNLFEDTMNGAAGEFIRGWDLSLTKVLEIIESEDKSEYFKEECPLSEEEIFNLLTALYDNVVESEEKDDKKKM